VKEERTSSSCQTLHAEGEFDKKWGMRENSAGRGRTTEEGHSERAEPLISGMAPTKKLVMIGGHIGRENFEPRIRSKRVARQKKEVRGVAIEMIIFKRKITKKEKRLDRAYRVEKERKRSDSRWGEENKGQMKLHQQHRSISTLIAWPQSGAGKTETTTAKIPHTPHEGVQSLRPESLIGPRGKLGGRNGSLEKKKSGGARGTEVVTQPIESIVCLGKVKPTGKRRGKRGNNKSQRKQSKKA